MDRTPRFSPRQSSRRLEALRQAFRAPQRIQVLTTGHSFSITHRHIGVPVEVYRVSEARFIPRRLHS